MTASSMTPSSSNCDRNVPGSRPHSTGGVSFRPPISATMFAIVVSVT